MVQAYNSQSTHTKKKSQRRQPPSSPDRYPPPPPVHKTETQHMTPRWEDI